MNRHLTHETELCVIGGGVAGFCAAVAAARRGAKVILMHDRPVLGGNNSSECRVQICGADRSGNLPNMRETGIIEELRLLQCHRNPNRNYSIQDSLFYEIAMAEKNLTLLLNCSCRRAETDGHHIVSVTGWQLTTYTNHTVKAKIFADCSGDGILAPLVGAEFRVGREARSEFNESIAPEEGDDRTMGMTCLFHANKYETPQSFTAPEWANVYESCDELPVGINGHKSFGVGYWWIELGGEYDSIHDTEMLRDELLKITYGVWEHVKNRCPNKVAAANWALDWIQFLPGKRESRRYIGKHVLTQNEIEAEGRFDDIIAYGGWSMDDHHPAGFHCVKHDATPTIFHPAPSPYGIPYGVLVSRNIDNLMFAGRNASCTHAAMSSTRVIGTCGVMGQALGTAAAMAVENTIKPAAVSEHMLELQAQLQDDDCYLPFTPVALSDLTMESTLRASQGDPEPVRDGWHRPIGDDDHCWIARVGDQIGYCFDEPTRVNEMILVLDSAMDRYIQMSKIKRPTPTLEVPDVMPKVFHVEGVVDGEWQELARVEGNFQRRVCIPIDADLQGIRFVLDETWGAEESKVFCVEVR